MVLSRTHVLPLPRPLLPVAGIAILLLTIGCSDADSQSLFSSGDSSMESRANTSAEAAEGEDGSSSAFGGDVELSPDSPQPCTKAKSEALLAADSCSPIPVSDSFSSALCACEDIRAGGVLLTRSFRSPNLLRDIAQSQGHVGANRQLSVGGLSSVGGDLTIAGTNDSAFVGGLRVGRDLQAAGDAHAGGLVRIERDVWLGSDLTAVGLVGIGGDLHRQPDTSSFALALANVQGQRSVHEFDVPAPCACKDSELLDVAGLIEAAGASNDNARVGLRSDPFVVRVGIGTALELPSGDFYLRGIAAAGALRLVVQGKTRLFVDGDFVVGGLFRLALEPGAELDLFVREDFVAAGGALFGDPREPSAARFYVGGDGDIALAGVNVFAGNLYAPKANVLVGALGQVRGSLFAKNVIAAGVLEVGYDERIRDIEQCDPSDTPTPADPPPGGTPAAPPEGDTPPEPSPADPTAPPPEPPDSNEPPDSSQPPVGEQPPCTTPPTLR